MWHKPCRTFHPWCLFIKTRCLFISDTATTAECIMRSKIITAIQLSTRENWRRNDRQMSLFFLQIERPEMPIWVIPSFGPWYNVHEVSITKTTSKLQITGSACISQKTNVDHKIPLTKTVMTTAIIMKYSLLPISAQITYNKFDKGRPTYRIYAI